MKAGKTLQELAAELERQSLTAEMSAANGDTVEAEGPDTLAAAINAAWRNRGGKGES